MSNRKGKSFDSLMKHIREYHQVDIGGSTDKKRLISMGYYHGYKGYRFYRTINHMFPDIDNFDQIIAIAKFDQEMKTLFYPLVMKFETTVKNITVNQSVRGIEPSFDNIYKVKLTDYRSLDPHDDRRAYRQAINQRLKLRKIFDGQIAEAYRQENKIIR